MAIAYWVMNSPIVANPAMVMPLMWGPLATTVGVMCCMMCNPDITRRSPQNYILLFVFTIAEAVMIGFISAQYTQESVIMVLCITAVVVFGLTLFACQTSIDFTVMGAYLFAAVLVLLGFGFMLSMASLFGATGPAFQGLRLVYALGGALIFSMFLVYDTQLIIGGKHKHQFGTDDYIMACLNLYIDIIQLFLFLLQLFGDRK